MMRPEFISVQEYGQRFTDAGYWRPYIENICGRHNIPMRNMCAGLAGTNPVFLVDDGGQGCVVKLFETNFFAGTASFCYEREIYNLAGTPPAIPAPALIAEGDLFGDGVWPYLIITLIPGASLGEVAAQVGETDWENIARFAGQVLRKLHDRPLAKGGALEKTRIQFRPFIVQQKANCTKQHEKWQTLPERLIAQLEGYLLPADALVDRESSLCLIHADLNWDHILGEFVDNHWVSHGVIDFGDARVGDRLYELVVVHLGLFRSDKTLLRLCLQAYGENEQLQRNFVSRAMNYTLLHEYNVLSQTPAAIVEQAATLEELAIAIWAL